MRQLNKIKKAKREAETLTIKDFSKYIENKNVNKFTQMLNNDLYAFRIKEALYDSKRISPKGFLYNDNIYNLPMGKKDENGEILINTDLMLIFDRFLFSESIAEKGDALTSFLIDHDDEIYKILKDNAGSEKKISESDYIDKFGEAYSRVSSIILASMIQDKLDDNAELVKILDENKKRENKWIEK